MSSPQITASTQTSLSVFWTAPAISTLLVNGYILNIDNGAGSDPVPVYIGVNRPDILQYQIGGLTTGLPYRLTVQAQNVNGLSLPSPVSSFFACSPPSNLQTPHYINSTSSTIAIRWQAPSNLGGCPVLGYQIFTSDGLSNAVNIPVPTFNSLNPNLNSFVIDMSSSGVVGLIYKIRI